MTPDGRLRPSGSPHTLDRAGARVKSVRPRPWVSCVLACYAHHRWMKTSTVPLKPDKGRRRVSSRPSRRPGRFHRWWPGLIVVGTAVTVYLTALPSGFVSDAQGLIPDNPSLLKSNEWLAWFRRPYFWGSYVGGGGLYRPLSILSYVVTLRLAGASPLAFLAGNILLHALVSSLVFLVGKRLIGAQAAWLGALLFAVHPLHTEAVAWVGGRPDVLCAVFAMGSAFYFLRATETGARHPALFVLVTVALYFVALSSKEHAITVPIWFAVAWLIERDTRSGRWAAATLTGSAVAVVLFLALRSAAFALAPGLRGTLHPGSAWYEPLGWLAGLAAIAKYVWLFVWPRALTFDYTADVVAWTESRHVPPFDAVVGFVCVVALLAALAWACRRDRGLALVLALVPITYAVVSGFPFTPQLYIAERFTYLPSAGACLAAGWGLVRIGRVVAERAASRPGPRVESTLPRWHSAGVPGRILTIVLAGVILVLGMRTAVRNMDWRNEDTVMVAALAVSADSPLALRRMGDAQYRQGNHEQARALLERSLQLNPRRTEPYLILADIYRKEGDIGALVELSLRAEARLSRHRALLHLGGLLWQIGRREEAERLVRRVVIVHPDFIDSRLALGGLLLDGRRPEQALEQFRAASTLEPQNGLAWYGMARASAALGRADEARVYADRARSVGLPPHVPRSAIEPTVDAPPW